MVRIFWLSAYLVARTYKLVHFDSSSWQCLGDRERYMQQRFLLFRSPFFLFSFGNVLNELIDIEASKLMLCTHVHLSDDKLNINTTWDHSK